VKLCQSKGKAVILSLGGAAGAYGFSDDAEAKDFAHMIWNLFLGGSSATRPLDGATLDGVDLEYVDMLLKHELTSVTLEENSRSNKIFLFSRVSIEGGSSVGYPAFIAELRSLFATDTSKRYYITAAPQCPFPGKKSEDECFLF